MRTLADGLAPDWSPDRSAIAYVCADPAGSSGGAICTFRLADGHISQLTPFNGSGSPAWSPAGTEIAFTRQDPGPDGVGTTVHVMRADGTADRRLTPVEGEVDLSPTWAPDGTRLAYTHATVYTSACCSTDGGIYTVDADGSSPRLIRPESNFANCEYEPKWSRNGNEILIAEWVSSSATCNLITMLPDGSKVQMISSGWNGSTEHSWSPDGHQIAVTGGYPAPNQTQGLWLMAADGSALRELKTPPPAAPCAGTYCNTSFDSPSW